PKFERGSSRTGRALYRASLPWSCGAVALPQLVHSNGQDDDRADHHLLPEWRNAQQVASVGNQPHQKSAGDSAGHRTFASRKACATEHHGSNDGKRVTLAGSRLAGHEPRKLDHARKTRERAAEYVDQHEIALYRNTGVPRGLDVTADGVGVTAQPRIFQDE